MIFDQWHRHSTVVVKCCKLDAPPKSSKSLFVHQNQISMYTTMTTMSKTFGHEYTHYDIGFQQWQSGDTNFLSPLDAAASSCLLNVVTTKGCFVLSPTWIIWISISCTSERKTKKPTNIGFTNQRIARSFFVSYGERIFGGAMGFAYRESASEGDDGKRSLSGKTQNG
jgi:hypothetical protein